MSNSSNQSPVVLELALASQTDVEKGAGLVGYKGKNLSDFLSSQTLLFESVADIKAASVTFEAGKTLKTANYYEGISGGGGTYTVKTSVQATNDGDIIDGFGNHALNGALVAVLNVDMYTPFLFGARTGVISSDNLEAFNNCVTQQNKASANYIGNFLTNRQFVIGHPTVNRPVLLSMYFDMKITTTHRTSDDAVVFDKMDYTTCSGRLKVDCGSSRYSSRRQRDCVLILKAERFVAPTIDVTGAKRNGILATSVPPGKTSLSSAPYIRARFCGGDVVQTAQSFTNRGSANSIKQFTEIVLDEIPEFLDELDYVDFDGNPYLIQSVDVATKTIEVHPWILAPVIGDINLLIGSGVRTVGGDSSLWNIGTLDLMNNPIMYKPHSLYPPTVGILHSNYSKIVVAVGRRNNAVQGGGINLLYVEGGGNTSYSAVVSSGAMDAFYISCAATAYLKNTRVLAANNGIVYTNKANPIASLSIGDDNSPAFAGNTQPNNRQKRSSSIAPKFNASTSVQNSFTRDYLTVKLQYNPEYNRNFGTEAQTFFATGTGANGEADGTWTFNPPDGWTVNGAATASASGMVYPTLFYTHYDIDNKNIRVSKLEMVGL